MAKENKEKKAKLSDTLLVKKMHVAEKNPGDVSKAQKFCEDYKRFLDEGKTEREVVFASVSRLEKAGYRLFEEIKTPKAGDKFYFIHRDKGVVAGTVGSDSLEKGMHMAIAHLDSPRLDLKPNPLYETDELAYFKTHYYGGIRKYQWVTIPLSMHGVVIKNNGERVFVNIGEKDDEPCFTITDLLPHLAAEQNKRTLAEGIKGEELNILVGALPCDDKDEKEKVKLEAMRLLYEKYGFTEHDFVRAEIEFVPANKAVDIGFDRSMISGYGQDDRVCCYTALAAEIATKKPKKWTLCVMTDKEETGSDGNTGLAGEYLFHFIEDLAEKMGVSYHKTLANSACLSADVNVAFDPTFPNVFEKNNASFLNHGVVVSKYHGARGKAMTSDASAEFMGKVTNMLDKAGVAWQTGGMGKVDEGGGGTVAKYVANRNVDVVDVGVPVLSMHAPMEVTSKLDIYSTFCAFKEFAKQ